MYEALGSISSSDKSKNQIRQKEKILFPNKFCDTTNYKYTMILGASRCGFFLIENRITSHSIPFLPPVPPPQSYSFLPCSLPSEGWSQCTASSSSLGLGIDSGMYQQDISWKRRMKNWFTGTWLPSPKFIVAKFFYQSLPLLLKKFLGSIGSDWVAGALSSSVSWWVDTTVALGGAP